MKRHRRFQREFNQHLTNLREKWEHRVVTMVRGRYAGREGAIIDIMIDHDGMPRFLVAIFSQRDTGCYYCRPADPEDELLETVPILTTHGDARTYWGRRDFRVKGDAW